LHPLGHSFTRTIFTIQGTHIGYEVIAALRYSSASYTERGET